MIDDEVEALFEDEWLPAIILDREDDRVWVLFEGYEEDEASELTLDQIQRRPTVRALWPQPGDGVEIQISSGEWVRAQVVKKSVSDSGETRVWVEAGGDSAKVFDLGDVRVPVNAWPLAGDRVEGYVDGDWYPGSVKSVRMAASGERVAMVIFDGYGDSEEAMLTSDLRPTGTHSSVLAAAAAAESEQRRRLGLPYVGDMVEVFTDGHWTQAEVLHVPPHAPHVLASATPDTLPSLTSTINLSVRLVMDDEELELALKDVRIPGEGPGGGDEDEDGDENALNDGEDARGPPVARSRAFENIVTTTQSNMAAKAAKARRKRGRHGRRRSLSKSRRNSGDSDGKGGPDGSGNGGAPGSAGTELKAGIEGESGLPSTPRHPMSGGQGGPPDSKARKRKVVSRYIEESFPAPVPLDQLSSASGISRSSLNGSVFGGSVLQHELDGELPQFATGSRLDAARSTVSALKMAETRWAATIKAASRNGTSWEAQARSEALEDFHRIRKTQAALLKAERRTARLHAHLKQQQVLSEDRSKRARRLAAPPAGSPTALKVISSPGPFHWGLSRTFPRKPEASSRGRSARRGRGSPHSRRASLASNPRHHRRASSQKQHLPSRLSPRRPPPSRVDSAGEDEYDDVSVTELSVLSDDSSLPLL